MEDNERLIAVGASSGGMEAFLKISSELDPALPAAICFVLHISNTAPTLFAEKLSRQGPFSASFASDGEALKKGHIYLAPPDAHMVVADGKLRLARTPRENWSRPAIDPLFRSAAAYYGNRAIGALLTGLLDDGVDGLGAIKRCGGVTVVQDPRDATYPDMPQNAIMKGHADHVAPLAAIPRLLMELAHTPAKVPSSIPEDLRQEVEFLEQGAVTFSYPEQSWQNSDLACPDCGGPLWEKKGGTGPFGCSVGHRYSPLSLMAVQDNAVEQSLWAAVRMLQERYRVLEKLAEEETRRGNPSMAEVYSRTSEEWALHAKRLQEFLQQLPKGVPVGVLPGQPYA